MTTSTKRQDSLNLFLLLAIEAMLVALSWNKWVEPLVDFGREVYIPWQLAQGKILYQDIAYFNGPLAAHLNSLVFRLAGPSIHALVYFNLLLLTVTMICVYRLSRKLGGQGFGFCAGLVFLTSFAIHQNMPNGSFNFLAPYSHEATQGTLFALAAFCFLYCGLESLKAGTLVAAGFFLGLTFLGKAEIFASLFLGMVSLTIFYRRPEVLRRRELLFGFLLPILAFYLFLSTKIGVGEAAKSVLGSWYYLFGGNVGSKAFYRTVTGFYRLDDNLFLISLWIGGVGGTVILVALLEGMFPETKTVDRAGKLTLTALMGYFAFQYYPYVQEVGWSLSFFTVFFLGWNLLEWRHAGKSGEVFALRMGLGVFATVLLSKIIFHPQIGHYGFYLALPATILFFYSLMVEVPVWLERLHLSGGWVKFISTVALSIFCIANTVVSYSFYEQKTTQVGSGTDSFYTDASRGEIINQTLQTLQSLASEKSAMVVIPEGILLNYLTRRANPTPYINFMPVELGLFGEEKIEKALRSSVTEYVLLVHKDLRDYGIKSFGTEYGSGLKSWLEDQFELVQQFGGTPFDPETAFGIRLYRLKTAFSQRITYPYPSLLANY